MIISTKPLPHVAKQNADVHGLLLVYATESSSSSVIGGQGVQRRTGRFILLSDKRLSGKSGQSFSYSALGTASTFVQVAIVRRVA